jgi:hypothetical protein
MIRVIVIGALLAFLAGCGNEAGSPQQGGAEASLLVKHVVDGSAGLYMEGSVWHIRVADDSGDAVLDRKLMDDRVAVRLDPGRYTIDSEELPCDGTCSHLDPAPDRCSSEVEVKSGQQAKATVTLKPGKGCTIVESTP